jgi:hypothetical protein
VNFDPIAASYAIWRFVSFFLFIFALETADFCGDTDVVIFMGADVVDTCTGDVSFAHSGSEDSTEGDRESMLNEGTNGELL